MIPSHAIRKLAAPAPQENELSEKEAFELASAMLDGGVAELELGAILGAFALRPLASVELVGFARAARGRVNRLPLPQGGDASARRPVVVPSYGGAQQHPNLMPLVALALARFGIPALVHGPLEGHGRVATAAVLRELGILPCASLREVQLRLGDPGVAYAPTALILPALAQLLALRGRLGFENVAHQVARLVDPFGGEGLMLVPADDSTQLEPLRDAIAALGDHALLFEGAEGEAYADPQRRPAIEQLRAGERRVLFEAEPELAAAKAPRGASLPEAPDARSTARWIGMALDGKAALPAPIANLLACCLFAAGYTDDFNQSKAIVAVRAHKLVAA